MHILMTTDTVGGVWTYSLELAQALQAHDVKISLATMGAPLTDDQRQDAESLANVELLESDFALEWMDDPWDDVAAAGAWLQKLARQRHIDLVHLNQFAFGAIRWEVPCLVVGHSCVLSWHQGVKQTQAGPEWDVYRAVVQNGLQGAQMVVAPTCAMLDALEHHYGPLPAGRAILNGRRSTYGLPLPKQEVVLAAGRLWDEAKNVAAVVAAATHLPWTVQVAGIPRPGSLDADENENPYPGVEFLGRLSAAEMEDAFSRATIYALPARYEPFGLTPLEAALAGCALVLGDIPTLREVWGEAALFVPPEDPAALRGALAELIADADLRLEWVTKSTARARQLGEGQMADGYYQVYRELLGQLPADTAAYRRAGRKAYADETEPTTTAKVP